MVKELPLLTWHWTFPWAVPSAGKYLFYYSPAELIPVQALRLRPNVLSLHWVKLWYLYLGFCLFVDAGGAERAQNKRTAIITVLMAACRFCWGLHKGDSPILCQMLFSKSYVTQVSWNPKEFLLQGNSWGSPGWMSNISSLHITDLSRPSLAAPPATPTPAGRWRREPLPSQEGKVLRWGEVQGTCVSRHNPNLILGILQHERRDHLTCTETQLRGVHTGTNEPCSFISDFHCINSYFK